MLHGVLSSKVCVVNYLFAFEWGCAVLALVLVGVRLPMRSKVFVWCVCSPKCAASLVDLLICSSLDACRGRHADSASPGWSQCYAAW